MEAKELEIYDILEECLDNINVLGKIIEKDESRLEKSEKYKLEELYGKFEKFYFVDGNKEKVKRHSYSKISGWVIDKNKEYGENINDNIDRLLLILEYILDNICENKDIDKCIRKLIDHIELEQKRLNYSDSRYSEFTNEIEQNKNLMKESLSISKKAVVEVLEGIETFDKRMNSHEEEIKNTKFDLIALTTLIFTAFTMISLNATIITAIIQAQTNYILGQIILAIIIVNAIVLSSVFLIYSIIRKIHGDIENAELYRICIFIAFIYITAMLIVVKSKMLNTVILPK